jgi:hypothetical protein
MRIEFFLAAIADAAAERQCRRFCRKNPVRNELLMINEEEEDSILIL